MNSLRTRHFFKVLVPVTMCFLASLSSALYADDLLDIEGNREGLVHPHISQEEFKEARIDSENFEIIAYLGTYNIEHFDTQGIFGVKGSFHLNHRFFIDVDYGSSSISGRLDPTNASTAVDESLIRYDASLGYNFFEGTVFWENGFALHNEFYVKYGKGKLEINNVKNNLGSLSIGTRLLHPNDKLVLQLALNKDSIESGGAIADSSALKFFVGLGIYF